MKWAWKKHRLKQLFQIKYEEEMMATKNKLTQHTPKLSIFLEYRVDKLDVKIPEKKNRKNHLEWSKKTSDL